MYHNTLNSSSDQPPDDSCRDDARDVHTWRGQLDHEEPLLSANSDTRCRVPMKQKVDRASTTIRAGVQAAADHAHDAARIPFVLQYERKLFLLTWELTRWTLAELEFDAATCTFVEQRRSHFEWPREAFGVLLSRFALIERVETSLLQRTSEDFARWLSSQFQIYATQK